MRANVRQDAYDWFDNTIGKGEFKHKKCSYSRAGRLLGIGVCQIKLAGQGSSQDSGLVRAAICIQGFDNSLIVGFKKLNDGNMKSQRTILPPSFFLVDDVGKL